MGLLCAQMEIPSLVSHDAHHADGGLMMMMSTRVLPRI